MYNIFEHHADQFVRLTRPSLEHNRYCGFPGPFCNFYVYMCSYIFAQYTMYTAAYALEISCLYTPYLLYLCYFVTCWRHIQNLSDQNWMCIWCIYDIPALLQNGLF